MTKKRTTIHTLGEVVNLINDLVGDVLRNCPEVGMCALSFAKYRWEEKSLYFDLVVTTEDGREFGRKFRIGEEFFDFRFSNGIFPLRMEELIEALKRKLEKNK